MCTISDGPLCKTTIIRTPIKWARQESQQRNSHRWKLLCFLKSWKLHSGKDLAVILCNVCVAWTVRQVEKMRYMASSSALIVRFEIYWVIRCEESTTTRRRQNYGEYGLGNRSVERARNKKKTFVFFNWITSMCNIFESVVPLKRQNKYRFVHLYLIHVLIVVVVLSSTLPNGKSKFKFIRNCHSNSVSYEAHSLMSTFNWNGFMPKTLHCSPNVCRW